jgi:hypothetical protein
VRLRFCYSSGCELIRNLTKGRLQLRNYLSVQPVAGDDGLALVLLIALANEIQPLDFSRSRGLESKIYWTASACLRDRRRLLPPLMISM